LKHNSDVASTDLWGVLIAGMLHYGAMGTSAEE